MSFALNQAPELKALPGKRVLDEPTAARGPAGRCYSARRRSAGGVVLCAALLVLQAAATSLQAGEAIRAFCIDFNWGPGGPNGFAPPGLWADANPEEHVAWYAGLGANVIQTFAVSANGYAWYQGGKVPPQPGLRHDFTTQLVRLGHARGMKVMGYFCVAANTRWGKEHPDLSYGTPATFHLPLTDAYLDYLAEAITDGLRKTKMDGFMVDWLWNPSDKVRQQATGGKWLKAEQDLFNQLTGKPFPVEGQPTPEDRLLYEQKATERCWRRIHDTAKRVKPNCIIWLSCHDVHSPHFLNTSVFKEVDWLMDESGTPGAMREVAPRFGPRTRPLLCLVGWGDRHDARKILSDPANRVYGIYGFSKPGTNSLPLPIADYFGKPIDAFSGNDRNIAALARWFNAKPFDYVAPTGAGLGPRPYPERLQWWAEGRFGLFIHWGPVSLKETEISWSRANSNPKCPNHGKIPVEVYDNLYRGFNPTNFNAAEWVRLAKAAGTKYMVLTAKHCDGFLLWHSQVSDYNIANSPFQRDICAELAQAARKQGMRIGWYFSPMDWRDSDFRTERNALFLGRMQAEVRELLNNCGRIDLLWFDWDGHEPLYDQPRTYQIVKELRPDIIINNRLDLGPGNSNAQLLSTNADYYTPEQSIGAYDDQRPWESCMTISRSGQWAWGGAKDGVKPFAACLEMLIRCAGGDGNLLLNVGPMPNGQIAPEQAERLKELGAWLAKYSQSIYGTRGGPFKPGKYGASTRKGKTIFLHLWQWSEGSIKLPPLPAKVLRSRVLTGGKATVRQTQVGLEVSPPAGDRQPLDTIVVLELDRSALDLPAVDVAAPAPARAAAPEARPPYQWIQVVAKAPFTPRDGAGAFVFAGKMWLVGGWNPSDKKAFPRTCSNDVWASADGALWSLVKPNTFLDAAFDPTRDWEGRHTAGYAVHRNKMWIIGGDPIQGHYQSDVWNSSDGKTWHYVNKDHPVPWGPRVLHHTLAFKDKLWVLGGQTTPQFAPHEEIFYRDIWNSSDGIRWQQVRPEEPYWSARGMIGGSVVFNGRIWILGGGTYDTLKVPQRQFYNDVWSSPDGVHWTRHVESAPWAPRQYHDVAVFDHRMWVLEGYHEKGGNRNDVWHSADGVNWTQLPDTPWKPRHAASVFVHDNALWMVAGNNMEADVWKLVKTSTETGR